MDSADFVWIHFDDNNSTDEGTVGSEVFKNNSSNSSGRIVWQ